MSTRHVWGQYQKQTQYYTDTRYVEDRSSVGDYTVWGNYNDDHDSIIWIYRSIYISQSSGSISLSSGKGYNLSNYNKGSTVASGYVSTTSGNYYYASAWKKTTRLVGSPGVTSSSVYQVTSRAEQYQDYYYTQGAFIAYISSSNSSAYPSNDYTGSYWYVKQGSDSIDAASVELPAEPEGGQSVQVTVTSGSGKKYGGTVTYIYQYKLDGGSWNTLTTTTSTMAQLAIPRGTETVQVRVQAKDDIGFTSSDYTTSEIYEVSNGDPPFIQWSYPGTTYDMGEITEPFTFDYTVMDPDYGDTLVVGETIMTDKENWASPIYLNTYENVAIGTKMTFKALTEGAFFKQCPVDAVSTIKLAAVDNYELTSDVYELTFTKINDTVDVTLREPMSVEGAITEGVVYVTGLIPEDATFWVKVTNNAKDDIPVWQDVTADVLASRRFKFNNTVAVNGFSFNFQLYAKRGESKEAGFIDIIMGGFE